MFLDWYLDALAGYGRWQLEACRRYFGPDPRLLVLLPSWGIRPGEVEEAAAGGLSGESRGERRDSVTQGVDWERQLPLLAEIDGVAVCTTWLDPPDQGQDDAFRCPAAFLAPRAQRLGLGIWGENTGNNNAEEMRRCADRVRELGLEGLFWMDARDLGTSGHASLADYSRVIGAAGWGPPPHVGVG